MHVKIVVLFTAKKNQKKTNKQTNKQKTDVCKFNKRHPLI
jgi:hypothetical protein